MKQSLKRYLFNLKWPFAIILFFVSIGFVGENSWVNRYAQKREIAKLKQEIDEYNRKFEADKEVLHRMQADPDASAEVARERYLMKKADEDIYVFEDEQ